MSDYDDLVEKVARAIADNGPQPGVIYPSDVDAAHAALDAAGVPELLAQVLVARDMLALRDAKIDALVATVERVEALRESPFFYQFDNGRTGTNNSPPVVRASDLDAALGVTVTDTPTGAHLRHLPRERYDAVLDSGPDEPTEGES